MLSFKALSEKKTKITLNPKLKDVMEKKGCPKCKDTCGEDCKCSCHDKEMSEAKKDDSYLETDFKKRQKNNEKARKEMEKIPGQKNPHFEAKVYDPMEDDTFDHDEAEATRGQSGKNKSITVKKKTKKTTKEEIAYVSQEEVSEESNQESETETFLTFKQFTEGLTDLQRRRYLGRREGESKERLKRINDRKVKKAALASLEKHAKGMKAGIYDSYEAEGDQLDEFMGLFGPKTVTPKDSPSGTKSVEVGKKYPARLNGRPVDVTYDKQGNKSTKPMSPAKAGVMQYKYGSTWGMPQYNSYEPEGESVDEKIDVRKQSSKRKSLGRGSSINPDAKKTGYESPAEFRKTEKKLAPYMEAKNVHGEVEVPFGDIGKLAKKASKRIDTDVDGDVEHNDKGKGEFGEFVPSPDGKKKVFTGPKKVTKESFSNWRQDLIEVADEDGEKQIKEMTKNQKNKISINPKLGEAVEGIGGTLLEEVEIDELDVIINTIYDEFLEEGYTEDEIEEAFEVVLLDEATVTYGHDSKGLEPKKQSKLQGRMRYIKRKVGEKLSAAKSKAKEKVGMASAKAQVAAYNKARELSQKGSDVKNKAKTSLKRFVKRQAQKVVDRMSEEVEQIDEKAVSKKQQRFMGMVYAAKKGEAPASAEVAKAAAGMSKKDAKDFASTKHKKLPEVKESMQGEVEMTPQEVQLQRKSAQIDRKLAAIRQRKVQKQTSQQSQNKEV